MHCFRYVECMPYSSREHPEVEWGETLPCPSCLTGCELGANPVSIVKAQLNSVHKRLLQEHAVIFSDIVKIFSSSVIFRVFGGYCCQEGFSKVP